MNDDLSFMICQKKSSLSDSIIFLNLLFLVRYVKLPAVKAISAQPEINLNTLINS